MALTLGEILARNLRRMREERGLTQEALADLAGMNRNYVGMIERCENSPTVEMLERIGKALHVEAYTLLQRDRSR